VTTTTVLHASCVAVDGRAVLITGASGAGKSGLALRLMALGAELVSDDRTMVRVRDGGLIAQCPPEISGLIEARGVGILRAPALPEAAVSMVVDLSSPETERLPPHRRVTVLGVTCDLVLGSQSDHFPASILCYLKHGRYA
jgi:HPr kinase/phosphorylase